MVTTVRESPEHEKLSRATVMVAAKPKSINRFFIVSSKSAHIDGRDAPLFLDSAHRHSADEKFLREDEDHENR
jgi:hypothetical protein